MGLFDKKEIVQLTPTQLIAKEFAENAVKAIDYNLGKQIERCGFNLEKVKSREIELKRTEQHLVTENQNCKVENYIIGTFCVMAVRWSLNGFTIEVNSDAVIENRKAVKSGAKPLIGKLDLSRPLIDLNARMSEREIMIEARTQELLKEHADRMAE